MGGIVWGLSGLTLILAALSDFGDFLGDIESFKFPYSIGLMLFLRMDVAHHHVQLGVSQQNGQGMRSQWRHLHLVT